MRERGMTQPCFARSIFRICLLRVSQHLPSVEHLSLGDVIDRKMDQCTATGVNEPQFQIHRSDEGIT
jgi:hypothetical protein